LLPEPPYALHLSKLYGVVLSIIPEQLVVPTTVVAHYGHKKTVAKITAPLFSGYVMGGTIYMLCASASFATMAALVKTVGNTVPLQQLVFLRCLLALPVLLFFIHRRQRPYFVQAKGLLLIRSLFGMTAMLGFFYSLTHMPLADSVFIGRSQPLLVAVLAPLIVNEKTPKAAWAAIVTGLLGVACIMKPAMAWPTAAWVALGAASCAAMAQLLIRKLNRTDYPLVIVFNFTLLTAMLTGALAIPEFMPLNIKQWIQACGIAFFASIGQILMTTAYRKDRAPAVAAASYSSIVLSVVYGYFFWNEIPKSFTWVGACLIIGGGVLLVRSRIGLVEPASRITTG